MVAHGRDGGGRGQAQSDIPAGSAVAAAQAGIGASKGRREKP